MSKAEERALEAYPSTSHYWNAEPDKNTEAREFYKQGYRQAEKDNELTWEDLATIEKLGDDLSSTTTRFMSDEEFYKEVLKRFKERKGEGV